MPVASFTLVGNLGKTPEVQWSQAAEPSAYVRFSICVNRWDSKAEKERESWFWCVMFGKVAERFASNAQKGSTVYVSGEMQEETGEHKGKHSFVVREFDVVRNWVEKKRGGGGDADDRTEAQRRQDDDRERQRGRDEQRGERSDDRDRGRERYNRADGDDRHGR